jgi:hypothetical protein
MIDTSPTVPTLMTVPNQADRLPRRSRQASTSAPTGQATTTATSVEIAVAGVRDAGSEPRTPWYAIPRPEPPKVSAASQRQ